MKTSGEIKRQNSISVNGSSVEQKSKASNSRGMNTKSVKKTVRTVQRELKKTDDTGLQSVSQSLTLAKAGVKTFQAAQKATPVVLKTAKGVYIVGDTTVKVVKQIDSTIAMIQTGAIKLDRDTAGRLVSYTKNRIVNSAPAVKLSNAITAAKSKVGVKGAVSFVGKTAYKGTTHMGRGLNAGIGMAGKALMSNGDSGMQAAGMALKGVHYTIRGVAYTPKIAKTTYKGVKGAVHTGVKVVRGGAKTYKGVRTGIKAAKKVAKKAGVSKAARMYANHWKNSFAGKIRKGVAKAGHSVVTAAVDTLKALGQKMIIPLLMVLLVIALASTIINSVAGAVTAILSPFISDDSGEEIDETQLITQEITEKRAGLINELKETYQDNLVDNGGFYHSVRFFNAFNDTDIEFTDSNISTSIYTVKDYVEAIQPIFHTIIICEYDGEASKGEMKSLITEMWNTLNVIKTEEMPTEYCGMNIAEDGSVIPVYDADGLVHADPASCPNHSYASQYHADIDDGIAAFCDSWYFLCEGHQGTCTHHCDNNCAFTYICGGRSLTHLFHTESCKQYYCGHSHSSWSSASSPGCYSTNYCNGRNPMAAGCSNSTRHKHCAGYYECYGHRILALSVSLNSFGDLMNKYFLDEINSLEAKTRTEEEELRLNNLHDSYDVCLAYLSVLEEEYGYGSSSEIVNLDGVTLTSLTDYACSFIGNPYIWGGNDPNTGADCSGFVKYVFAHFGVAMNRTAHQQVVQGTLVDGIANAQPGDLIFWSENGTDDGVYHVAIYLGNNKIVHASNSRPYPAGGIKVSNVYGTIYKIKRML